MRAEGAAFGVLALLRRPWTWCLLLKPSGLAPEDPKSDPVCMTCSRHKASIQATSVQRRQTNQVRAREHTQMSGVAFNSHGLAEVLRVTAVRSEVSLGQVQLTGGMPLNRWRFL